MGFAMLAMLFATLGFAYDALIAHSKPAFVFLYCLANFFQNFGPNTTTFIIPGEAFPTRYRSTGHGISAATGKLGAIVAQAGFSFLKDRGGAPGSGKVSNIIVMRLPFLYLRQSNSSSNISLKYLPFSCLPEFSQPYCSPRLNNALWRTFRMKTRTILSTVSFAMMLPKLRHNTLGFF